MTRLGAFCLLALLAPAPAGAVVSRHHREANLGMRLSALRAMVPAGAETKWADIVLFRWDLPDQPDYHVCAQSFKGRIYRVVVFYDPKYGRTRFMDFVAFVRFETGRRPRWTVESASGRTVGVWQDNMTRLELWEPGQNTASFTAVYFDLRSARGLKESHIRPQDISWRGCGGDQR